MFTHVVEPGAGSDVDAELFVPQPVDAVRSGEQAAGELVLRLQFHQIGCVLFQLFLRGPLKQRLMAQA